MCNPACIWALEFLGVHFLSVERYCAKPFRGAGACSEGEARWIFAQAFRRVWRHGVHLLLFFFTQSVDAVPVRSFQISPRAPIS